MMEIQDMASALERHALSNKGSVTLACENGYWRLTVLCKGKDKSASGQSKSIRSCYEDCIRKLDLTEVGA